MSRAANAEPFRQTSTATTLVGTLLFVNVVLGVISRVAQQMNIFAIGFPITLAVGCSAFC